MAIEGAAAVIGRVTRLLASTADDAAFRERVRSDHGLRVSGLSPKGEPCGTGLLTQSTDSRRGAGIVDPVPSAADLISRRAPRVERYEPLAKVSGRSSAIPDIDPRAVDRGQDSALT